jgi:hypothetical protein
MARDVQQLGRALREYVVYGDFDETLWPFIPKAQLKAYFDIILGGGLVYYHSFLARPIDPTQWFTVSKRPVPPITPIITPPPVPTVSALVALRLNEYGYNPPFAPGQTWNWNSIVWAFPNADVPYSVTIEELAGIVPVPGADFVAYMQISYADPLLPVKQITQGWFVTWGF